MKRLLMFVVVVLGVLGCMPTAQESTPVVQDPKETLAQAVINLRQASTFRLLIEQTGVEYTFSVSLDAGASSVTASMRRGEVQYMSPNTMYGNINLRVNPLPPIGVEIFAQAADQWFKLSSADWINFPIAEGFDPEQLVREGSGFSIALEQLREVNYVGLETLIDGTQAIHIRGAASGSVINQLMFDLLDLQNDNVVVDVYIAPDSLLPVQLSVTVPETAANGEADTRWTIEIYDFNQPAVFTAPAGITLPEGAGA